MGTMNAPERRSTIDHPLRAFGVPGTLNRDFCDGAIDFAEILFPSLRCCIAFLSVSLLMPI
jgi:hypothetical protein